MRILILGGTVFLGRHVAEAALARGHEVTTYSRGLHGRVPDGAEHVRGDRADVSPLRGRDWDAAIDTSGYDPRHVAASAALDIGHYVFVSSCNAYPRLAGEARRRGLAGLAGRRGLRAGQGRRRAGRAAGRRGRARRPDRRPARQRLPAAVVGAADQEGGVVPAPGDPDRPVQVIDARDLAAFLLDLAEQRVAGAFNGTGPIGQTTMRELLEAAGDAELRWIPDEKLEAAEVEPWIELPLWLPERFAGTFRVGTERAAGRGPALPPGRRDRRRRPRLARGRRRGRARRLARRAPPAADVS